MAHKANIITQTSGLTDNCPPTQHNALSGR